MVVCLFVVLRLTPQPVKGPKYNGHDGYRRTGEIYKNNRRTTVKQPYQLQKPLINMTVTMVIAGQVQEQQPHRVDTEMPPFVGRP